MLNRLFGAKTPSADAAMRRLLIIGHQLVHGLTTPLGEDLSSWRSSWNRDDWSRLQADMQARSMGTESALRQAGLWRDMTDEERLFIASPLLELTEQQKVNVSWLMEGAVCLLWALRYVESLPPYDTQADLDLLRTLPNEPLATLVKTAALRPASDIKKMRDIAQTWHWRSRTRQLEERGGYEDQLPPGLTLEQIVAMSADAAAKGGDIPGVVDSDFPAFGKAYREATAEEYNVLTSIAVERHRALNWLCGRAPGHHWDETPTDT